MARLSGLDISARYFRMNVIQARSVLADRPNFTVSMLGASTGSQTSKKFLEERWLVGTPRGGRRTVPIRNPSPGNRSLPRRTIWMAILEDILEPQQSLTSIARASL
jgi:hypothetical protein